jgi:hypothetical protein
MSTTRDRLLSVLERKEPERVVWWPRIKHWYDLHYATDTLPKRYSGMYLDEVYNELGVIPREVWPGGLIVNEGDDIDVWTTTKRMYKGTPGDYVVTRYSTPKGEMRQVLRKTEKGTSTYPVEYFLKDQNSIDVYKYVLENRQYGFNWQQHHWGKKRYGKMIYRRFGIWAFEPLLKLVIRIMGFNKRDGRSL